jgi:hypothetical protein
MDDNARELIRLSDHRFTKKAQIDDYCQTVADEILPDRADFTRDRVDGEEFANHLYTSVPAQNCRDLSYAIGSLTRPKNQQWFDPKAREEWRNTENAKKWFAAARDKQRTLLYTQSAAFISTMEISDKDVVAFGNAVIGHTEETSRSGTLVYQPYHFRDCAWAEDAARQIVELTRKFKLALANWEQFFPGVPFPKEHSAKRDKDPYEEIELRHMVMPFSRYDFYRKPDKPRRNQRGMPTVASVYFEPNLGRVIQESFYFEFPYTVRRWQLQANSPYARSPAADLGLVEARLLQNQERVLMDAGELAVDPPNVATRDAVLGDVHNYPGGTTWVDFDYDERMGPSLRTLDHKGQMPIGLEMKTDTRQILAAAMFINKLSLPVGSRDMTVPEINERISEYIRSIGPAVEPFELHNALLLNHSFVFNLRIGNFGEPDDMPEEIKDAQVEYEFDGPIQIAYKRQKLLKAREVVGGLGEVFKLKPDILDNYDLDKLSRDSAGYIGGEPEWLVDEEVVQATRQQRAEKQAIQENIQKAGQIGQIAQGAIQTVPAAVQAEQMLRQQQNGQGQLSLGEGQGPPGAPVGEGQDMSLGEGPSMEEVLGMGPGPGSASAPQGPA